MRYFNKYKTYLSILIITFLTSCVTQRECTTIVGCNYDKNKDKTDYIILPYGTVSIPGKWEKTNYNSVSRQQFF